MPLNSTAWLRQSMIMPFFVVRRGTAAGAGLTEAAFTIVNNMQPVKTGQGQMRIYSVAWHPLENEDPSVPSVRTQASSFHGNTHDHSLMKYYA